jgi:RHS repeat-associated protein
VWAGSQELYEIQVPDSANNTASTREYDTQPLPLMPRGGVSGIYDPNPYYGIVAYTYGLVLDRPLSITRLKLRNYEGSSWLPFSIVPLWTPRGYADTSYFAATGASNCVAAGKCVTLNYPETYFAPAYGWATLIDTLTFAGTLLTSKSDRSGLLFRRNRYYDPATGRFTQQDPIGLAGGLNLYGYAGGDPVNFSDPFGLCPPEDNTTDDCQTDEDGKKKSSFCPAGSSGTPPNCTSLATGLASPGSCPNVSAQEWTLGQRAIAITGQNEEGFAIGSYGVIPMTGPQFRRTGSTIGPAGDWPRGTHTMVHSHPSGGGISEGDIAATNADGVRTVSAGVGTNRYGAYSRGGTPTSCNMPQSP